MHAFWSIYRLNNRVISIGGSNKKLTGSNSTLMAARKATDTRCGLETSARISVLKLGTRGAFRAACTVWQLN